MEAIAIEAKNQGSLNKSVQKIRKKLKNGLQGKQAQKSKVFEDRGVVYIGHIPHGFYEDEIKGYASQFGYVTRVRVARSKRTGRSKGYAFVEFRNSDVAKIFAETVDNYLMYDRLLKCKVVEKDKLHSRMMSSNITATSFPALKNQLKDTEFKNAIRNEDKEAKRIKKSRGKIRSLQSYLKEKGINLHFKVNDPSMDMETLMKGSPAILEIDESDDEITFKTPPHTIKVYKKSGTPKTPGKKIDLLEKSQSPVAKATPKSNQKRLKK